jgi:uncharacterized protein
MHQGHAMTEDVARRGVDFLLRHSDGHYRLRIIFFGGEPLLEFSLMKAIVAYARQKAIGAGKEVSFAITTNGTLLNQEVRLFLVENNFNTLVSLDGPQPMHDAARQFRDGRGSFQRIVPQVKALVREAAAVGVGIQGRTTLNRHHLGYVPELYEFMDRQMGFSGVSTPMVHRPAPAEFSFIEADLPQLKEDLARLGDLVVEKASLEGTPPAYGLFAFLDVLHQRSRPRRGCAAGRLAVTVDCNGKIYPCERFIGQENCCLGSVFSEEFRRDRIEWLSNQDRICAFDKCHKCYAMLYCKSTCVAERLLYLDKTGPTELDCEIYRTILLQILSVYVRVYYHPADGTCKRSQ